LSLEPNRQENGRFLARYRRASERQLVSFFKLHHYRSRIDFAAAFFGL
jgi:hypothetical protein